jgi:hypothetical protein
MPAKSQQKWRITLRSREIVRNPECPQKQKSTNQMKALKKILDNIKNPRFKKSRYSMLVLRTWRYDGLTVLLQNGGSCNGIYHKPKFE